jgi:hypothetical protein
MISLLDNPGLCSSTIIDDDDDEDEDVISNIDMCRIPRYISISTTWGKAPSTCVLKDDTVYGTMCSEELVYTRAAQTYEQHCKDSFIVNHVNYSIPEYGYWKAVLIENIISIKVEHMYHHDCKREYVLTTHTVNQNVPGYFGIAEYVSRYVGYPIRYTESAVSSSSIHVNADSVELGFAKAISLPFQRYSYVDMVSTEVDLINTDQFDQYLAGGFAMPLLLNSMRGTVNGEDAIMFQGLGPVHPDNFFQNELGEWVAIAPTIWDEVRLIDVSPYDGDPEVSGEYEDYDSDIDWEI